MKHLLLWMWNQFYWTVWEDIRWIIKMDDRIKQALTEHDKDLLRDAKWQKDELETRRGI